jgi:hypothetical protein
MRSAPRGAQVILFKRSRWRGLCPCALCAPSGRGRTRRASRGDDDCLAKQGTAARPVTRMSHPPALLCQTAQEDDSVRAKRRARIFKKSDRVPRGAASAVNPARHARPQKAGCAWLRARFAGVLRTGFDRAAFRGSPVGVGARNAPTDSTARRRRGSNKELWVESKQGKQASG